MINSSSVKSVKLFIGFSEFDLSPELLHGGDMGRDGVDGNAWPEQAAPLPRFMIKLEIIYLL